MCSDNEGSPNAVLEAMAMGTAVIAALAGGIVAVLAKGFPYNTGLVLATALGIAAGYLAETLKTRKDAAAQ